MSDKKDQDYSDEEAKKRFEQALRGARITGPKPMKDIPRKRSKKQRSEEKKPAK
jgi:hypothetical protein